MRRSGGGGGNAVRGRQVVVGQSGRFGGKKPSSMLEDRVVRLCFASYA